jgi:hypothetical protein
LLLSPAVREKKTLTMKLPFSKILLGLCLSGVSLARAEDVCEAGTGCSAGLTRNLKTETTRRLAGLSLVAQENGFVVLSLNGKGHDGASSIGVRKPSANAVVRSAFLFATTYNTGGAHVKLNGAAAPIVWDGTATNSFLHSFYADVTTLVKPTIDAALVAGELFIPVEEIANAAGTDGEVLAVIFDDPANQAPLNSVSLLFGALASAGDSFTINLAAPITLDDINDPNLIMDLSLGIGFGFQTPTYKVQFSEVVSGCLS